MKSRRDAREAEGARLEIVYPANNGIVGSTPLSPPTYAKASVGKPENLRSQSTLNVLELWVKS